MRKEGYNWIYSWNYTSAANFHELRQLAARLRCFVLSCQARKLGALLSGFRGQIVAWFIAVGRYV